MGKKVKTAKELERGEKLFSEGLFEEAKKCFQKLAKGIGPSKVALNNLGVIAHQEGDDAAARRFFQEALRIDPHYEEARTNNERLKEETKPGETYQGDTTVQQREEAAPHHQPALPVPGKAVSPPGQRLRVAVLCLPGLDSFLGDIVNHLRERYEVRTCYSGDNTAVNAAVRWADLVWLEWANQLVEALTRQQGLLENKRVICRIHSYEVLDGYLPRIDWSKVTKAVFVAPHVLDIARRLYPQVLDRTSPVVIPNGVDLEKFAFKERAPGFTLAVVGHVNNKKNPSLWPEILHRLVRIDPRYRLHIAGAMQEVRYGLYLEHAFKHLGLEKNVRFSGHVKDVAAWLEAGKVNYLLTTSIFESFGYGIAEAMAMGYRPLINNFPGAAGLWPTDCLFSSVDELIGLITNHEEYRTYEYRRFVAERYALSHQLAQIEELISSLMGGNGGAGISVAGGTPGEGIIVRGDNGAEKKDPAATVKPLVTIGIMNYNYAGYLDKAVNSVLEQSYDNTEILIVDDASTDGSIEIIKDYEAGYNNIRGIYHRENSGSAIMAFKDIIANARGEYLLFLSTDDYLFNNDVIKNYVDEFLIDVTLDYVYGNIQIVDNEGNYGKVWTYQDLTDEEVVYKTIHRMGSGIIPFGAGMFKLDFYIRNNLTFVDDPNNRVAGDTLNTLVYIKHGWKRKYIDMEAICYRTHNSNMTYDLKSRIDSIISINEYAVNNFALEMIFPEIHWERYAGEHKEALKMYVIGQNYKIILEGYCSGKIRVFDSEHYFDREQMREFIQPLVAITENYFEKSIAISKDFQEEIKKYKRQLAALKIPASRSNTAARKNEIIHEGRKLRESLLREYRDKYRRKSFNILIYAPENGAWKYGFMSWQQILNHMGHKTTLAYDLSKDVSFGKYDIFINIANTLYMQHVLENEGIASIPHKIGLVSKQNNDEAGKCTDRDLLNIALVKEAKYDFLISSFSHAGIGTFLKDWINGGIRVESVPFGFDPLIYYPEDSDERYDYFFVGTNSSLKTEETKKYLLPILGNYYGILRGANWNEKVPLLHPNNGRFFYNRSRINLNYHLESQKVADNEINERTFVISACGCFQLVDNPKILGKYFSEKELAIAGDEREYLEKFRYYLHKPEERQEMAYYALKRTYDNKDSLFARLEDMLSKVHGRHSLPQRNDNT
ncbi:MAG: glycosyltransferase [Syntrophales bacterium]